MNKATNAKIYLGKITSALAEVIKSKTGINVENYNVSLKADTVKHILKHHGNSDIESKRGQIAITEDDFEKIPKVISEFDYVSSSLNYESGKPVLTFKKWIKNNYCVVNYVSDKHHNLEVQTMYIQKKNSATMYDVQSPILTSRTNSGTSSIKEVNIWIQYPKSVSSLYVDNISQFVLYVKDILSINSTIQEILKNTFKIFTSYDFMVEISDETIVMDANSNIYNLVYSLFY